ncbi:GNAT family N-acetyltransferase [Streptomyces rishiriensis]|uniref:GNAT family N-acetyltransferase n=1 Tax=Streptomyces rishiriensis TaxID=68264 RepID=UPI0037AF78D4
MPGRRRNEGREHPDVRGCRDARADDATDDYGLLCEFATRYRPHRALFDAATFPGVLAAVGKGPAEFPIVESDGQVAGYALSARMPTLFAGGTVLELLELVVHEALRGGGLGSLLVRETLTQATRAGDAEVVVPTRRAVDFSRHLGFVETITSLKVVP